MADPEHDPGMSLKTIINEGVGELSDGFHTYNELYDHRNSLFLCLMKAWKKDAWYSAKHDDGGMYPGYFIAGIDFSHGRASYHLPSRFWKYAKWIGAQKLERAPEYDGYTSEDVLDRILITIIRF